MYPRVVINPEWDDVAMASLTADELIDRAEPVLRPRLVRDRWFGDVAAAIETVSGAVFVGVCIDTGATGYCAEQAAGAAMITAGETRVRQIVAVWRDSREGPDSPLFVLPPCGVCRRFLIDIDPENASAEVILGASESSTLDALLPLSGWSASPARRSSHLSP
ncbi:MAG: cytidine deaminase [Actinomycetota bacterium]|jgi:cytidine deaminase